LSFRLREARQSPFWRATPIAIVSSGKALRVPRDIHGQVEIPMRQIKTVAVFCGSNTGQGETYQNGARALGGALAGRGIGIVYGGTHKGLMGVLADAALAVGGTVHGVITQRLFDKGHLHPALTVGETVTTMAERKTRMLELADACIALPGGVGTVEEFMEAWTLNQLTDTFRPIGLLDIGGYYQPYIAFIDAMVRERFLPQEHRDSLSVAIDPNGLIDLLTLAQPPSAPKWL
jgi:uncharacterized protein (TIGR00730 family)